MPETIVFEPVDLPETSNGSQLDQDEIQALAVEFNF